MQEQSESSWQYESGREASAAGQHGISRKGLALEANSIDNTTKRMKKLCCCVDQKMSKRLFHASVGKNAFEIYHAGQNDYRPAFFISTSNSCKNDRDPAKDPRIRENAKMNFLSELILAFFFDAR